MWLLTADEMRSLDSATIDGGHAAGADLMERAGAGVVRALERHYGPVLGMRVLVLCGGGNNGGDGFVAARHLRAGGAEVHVGLAADVDRVRGDARIMLERMEAERLTVTPLSESGLQRLIESRDQWDFAIDALLGTGAKGAPEGLIADCVQSLRELDDAGTRVIAVDLPTGVNADTGEIARRAVRADLTATFGEPKRGHYLYPGRAFVGALEVIDIGLLAAGPETVDVAVTLAAAGEMAELVPRRDPRAHKGSAGRVLVAGGSPGLTGAITLCAQAATRAGAGYTMAAVPESLNDILEVKLTEESTIPSAQSEHRTLALGALDDLLKRAERLQAMAVGPGLSPDEGAAELARQLYARAPCPVVLDADGLNAFVGHTSKLSHPDRVLTPHLLEMERLSGVKADALEANRIEAAREWAQKWGVTLVLKGAPTVTASPDGRATVNPNGNPGMATLGMGDVLTGVIAALIAQGLDTYDAARLGVFVHGMAGDFAAKQRGEHGLTAGDVLGHVPAAMKKLVRVRHDVLEHKARTR